MASAIIHICVAKELNKKLKLDEYEMYLGTIAPDMSKQVGQTKNKSHFIINEKNSVPNIKLFLEKYKNDLNNPFNLGYFIHLYTDKLWFDEFIETLKYNESIKLLDGTIYKTSNERIQEMIYEDYTNLNVRLIDHYNLDLKLFYEDFRIPNTNIDEIDKTKLNILIDKMGIIIKNSNSLKSYIFDINIIIAFIQNTVNEIENYIKENNLIDMGDNNDKRI